MTFQSDDLSTEARQWMRQLMFGFGDAANPNSESVDFLLSTLRNQLRSFVASTCESRNSRSLNEHLMAKGVSGHPVALESLMKSVWVQDAMRDTSVATDKSAIDEDGNPVSRGHRKLRRIYSDYERDKETARQKIDGTITESLNTKNKNRLLRLERYTRNMTTAEYQKYANARLHQGSTFRRPKVFVKWLLDQEESNVELDMAPERNGNDGNDESPNSKRGPNANSKRSYRNSENGRSTKNSSGAPSKRPRHHVMNDKLSSSSDVIDVDDDSSSGVHYVDLDFDESEVGQNDGNSNDNAQKIDDKQLSNPDVEVTDASASKSTSKPVEELKAPNPDESNCLGDKRTETTDNPLANSEENKNATKLHTADNARTEQSEKESGIDTALENSSSLKDIDASEKPATKGNLKEDNIIRTAPELGGSKATCREKADSIKAAMERELFGENDNDSDTDDVCFTSIHSSNSKFQPFIDSDEDNDLKDEVTDDEITLSPKKRRKRVLILSESETSTYDQSEDVSGKSPSKRNQEDVTKSSDSEAKTDRVCNRRKAAERPTVKPIPKQKAISSRQPRDAENLHDENPGSGKDKKSEDKEINNDNAPDMHEERDESPSIPYGLRSGRRKSKSQPQRGHRKEVDVCSKSLQGSNAGTKEISKSEDDNVQQTQGPSGDVRDNSANLDFNKTSGSKNSNSRPTPGLSAEDHGPSDREEPSSNSFDFKRLHVSQTAETMLYSLGCDYIGRVIDYVFHNRAKKWTKKAVEDPSLFHVQIQKHELEVAVASVDLLGPEMDLKENPSLEEAEEFRDDVDKPESRTSTDLNSSAPEQSSNSNDTNEKGIVSSESFVSPPPLKKVPSRLESPTKSTVVNETSPIPSVTKLQSDNLNDASSKAEKSLQKDDAENQNDSYTSKNLSPSKTPSNNEATKGTSDVKQPLSQKKDTLLATLRTETEMVKRLTAIKMSPRIGEGNENSRDTGPVDASNFDCPVTDTIVSAVMERLPEAALCLTDLFERESSTVKPMIATALVNLPSSSSRLSLCRVLHDLSSDPNSSRDAVYKVLDRLNDVPNKASRIKLVDAMVDMMKKKKIQRPNTVESVK